MHQVFSRAHCRQVIQTELDCRLTKLGLTDRERVHIVTLLSLNLAMSEPSGLISELLTNLIVVFEHIIHSMIIQSLTESNSGKKRLAFIAKMILPSQNLPWNRCS